MEFLEVGVFSNGSLVLHSLCVCLGHLLAESPLQLCLLLGQIQVGLFLSEWKREERGGGERERAS